MPDKEEKTTGIGCLVIIVALAFGGYLLWQQAIDAGCATMNMTYKCTR